MNGMVPTIENSAAPRAYYLPPTEAFNAETTQPRFTTVIVAANPVTCCCPRPQSEQVMSLPQHSGDLILPSPLGHSAIRTLTPSAVVKDPSTRSAPQ
jgi:hypothetical protein